MTDDKTNKRAIFEAAASEIKKVVSDSETLDIIMLLQRIIGDLSWEGFVIARCKAKGLSHQQCANRLGMTKEKVRYYHEKCVELQHDIALKDMFPVK